MWRREGKWVLLCVYQLLVLVLCWYSKVREQGPGGGREVGSRHRGNKECKAQ